MAQNSAGTALGKTKLRVQGRGCIQIKLNYTIVIKYTKYIYVLFTFHPAVPPVIRSETQDYVAPVDSSVTLECHAEGSPPPSITWHKDAQPLSDSVRQRVLSSGSLQIAFIQRSDAGRYTCTAANAAGAVSLNMGLTVQSRFYN